MTLVSSGENPRFIARQLVLGFGSVTVVAVAMCSMLVVVIHEVAGLVESMRDGETSIRQGIEISTAVREMSIHSAHKVIEGDGSHLDHYNGWRREVQSRAKALAARIPPAKGRELELLVETTEAMHKVLLGSALPAARRGDMEAVRRYHRELQRLGENAARRADNVATQTTQQMAHAHDDATRTTRIGLIGGGLCAFAIIALSVVFTVRLGSAVLRPLRRLTDAASHYGRGDFAFRVGDVGKGELAAVADAFSEMADELARREAQLLAKERMAAIGQLAAGVAHELNNPIGIIRGYLGTMSADEDRESLRQELAILDDEAHQCQRVADDLLSYARTDQLALDPIDMKSFLSETVRRYQMNPEAEHVRIEVAADDAVIRADATRLRQVVLNLLSNAAHVSQKGALVELVGTAFDDSYRVEVIDNGPGIPLADRQRVFEPFFSKRKGGTGLGLAVCQGIVHAHGGTVEIADAKGGGAVFRLTLPRQRAAETTPSTTSREGREDA